MRVDCPPTHRNSPITFCGEAPGQDEVWLKQGFVGPAGRLQEQICQIAGLSFASVNLTNVIKERPPGNNFGVFYKDKAKRFPTPALLEWYKVLQAELKAQPPKVVVACGNEALRALTGLGDISKRAGSVYECSLVDGLPVVATLHPSAILHSQNWQQVYITAHFLQKTALPLTKHAWKPRPYRLVTSPSLPTICDLFAAAIKFQWRWVVDIETRGNDVACVGVGFGGCGESEIALVVPIETTTGPYFSLAEEAAFWKVLQRLGDANPNFIGQNLPFDLSYLSTYGFMPRSVYMDTMTAHHLLYAELPKRLEFLNVFYPTGIPYYKDEGKTWGKREPDQVLHEYCAKDLVATLRVSYALDDELKAAGMYEQYCKDVLPCLPLALEMQHRGFCVDKAGRKLTQQTVLVEWQEVHKELVGLVGKDVNVRSSVEVPQLLYEQYDFPKLYGKSNADEDVLVTLKSWLEGQKPLNHTKHCDFGKKPCKHKTQQDLDMMRRVLVCVMKERKLLKAESSYLADNLYERSKP